mmetsp:Transcript_2297/g.3140  ORF Transcript_2297/g.3140 Transcript_2297/m.3140 type:complete len:220 (-) Transcript_2297:1137-1796(-)
MFEMGNFGFCIVGRCVFRDAVCYDAVSNMLIFPEEKQEQSSEPSLFHETSNISPDPCDSDCCFSSPVASDHSDKLLPPVASNSPFGLGDSERLLTGFSLLKLYTTSPLAALHTLTVASKEAVQRYRGLSILAECGPVGVHLRPIISLVCPLKSNRSPFSSVHILAVASSEQLASSNPPGLQQMKLTSSWWPVNVAEDLLTSAADTWQMWMALSEEQVAK